jgi:Cys-tRNA(Pro)/Cys-tRNA(Cys) deacylase
MSWHLSYHILYLSDTELINTTKMKINKTNAARLLDKAKIAYELIPYEVDENDLSAVHVAADLGENIEQVFKTLVLHGDKSGYFVLLSC